MATNGAEDIRKGLRRSRRLSHSQTGLIIHAQSVVVHAPNTRSLPACPLQKNLQAHPTGLTPLSGLAPLRVAAHDLHPLCFSGILPSSPGPVLAPQHLCTRSASSCAPRRSPRTARYASIAPTGVSKGPSSLQSSTSSSSSSFSLVPVSSQCHSPCLLDAQLSHCQLDPLRFGTGLLGKRASSPQLYIYPTCPSPPKASVSRRGVVVAVTGTPSAASPKASMPTNQSSPWSGAKLREAGSMVNGLTTQLPSSVAVPSFPTHTSAFHSDPPDKLPCCPPSNRCKGDGRAEVKVSAPSAVMPSQESNGDVVLSYVQIQSELTSPPSPRPAAVNPRAQKVKLPTSIRKLARTSSARLRRTLNGYGAAVRSTGAIATARVPSRKSPLQSLSQREREPPATVAENPSGDPCASFSPAAAPLSSHHCAIPGEMSSLEVPLLAPSVYSVTSDLSAIHLTIKGGAQVPPDNSCPSPSFPMGQRAAETRPELEPQGQEIVAMLQNGEEEFPEELENNCSGDDNDRSDCFSMHTDGALDTPEDALSVEEPMSTEVEDERVERPALVPSLFPLMPSTIYFSLANERVALLPLEQRKLLKWRMSSVTPNVVKHTITRSHFKVTKKNHDWLGCWGHHMKSPGFKAIKEYQKLNHFPGSFQIGRKDRLWRNLSKMQVRFGKREFSFFPRSFVLPQDIKLLRKAWEDGGGRQKWIIKPPASARGIGIQVIHKWSQMPRKRPLLVQKYIHKPYLISGNKFDLRIYVYVTSYDPLRIYIFNDGLVRFASCKYSSSMKSLGNKFMHLTNYSVNKKNAEYQTNSDDKACQGHKWALKALWQYLGNKGINTTVIWEKIKDMVIKTIIASESYVNTLVKMHLRSSYSCHELFGFDIMLDEKLKPWVLEVNISPSLHSNTALDVAIKGQMIRDVLNLAGFVLPQSEEVLATASSSASSSTSSLCAGGRERCKLELSTDEKVKRAFYLSQRFADQDFFSSVLDVLTPDDVRVLAETEDELMRHGEFQRVFPSPTSGRYLRFFEHPRYLNILLNQWEHKYWQNRSKGIDLLRNLCQKGVHLGNLSDTAHHWSSKSYTGHVRTDFSSNPSTKPELTRSSVVVSQSVPSPAVSGGIGDEEAFERDIQSITSSLPDISTLGSASVSPSATPTLSPTSTPTPTLSPSPTPIPTLRSHASDCFHPLHYM